MLIVKFRRNNSKTFFVGWRVAGVLFLFFWENSKRRAFFRDPWSLLVISAGPFFFFTLSDGQQQGHIFKFLGGQIQPLRGTQVRPCFVSVFSASGTWVPWDVPPGKDVLVTCLGNGVSFIPLFGSYSAPSGVKSTEKSCKKDTIYLYIF